MYEINLKSYRKDYLPGFIFFFIGLLFAIIIGFLAFGGMIEKMSMDSSVKATLIEEKIRIDDEDGEYLYSPVYHYIVDGKEYTCNIGYYSSIRVTEEQNMVYYDSTNPAKCVTDYTANPNIILYFIFGFSLIFVIVGILLMLKVRKNIKKKKYLAVHGTLIQNLPYEMESSNVSVNGRIMPAIGLDYTLPNGDTVHLTGRARLDGKLSDSDGYADLLIDLNNPKNYHIDFNITRK